MHSDIPYGYSSNRQGNSCEINPEQAQIVRDLSDQAATSKRVALYPRSATSKESVEKDCALATQIKQCRDYCDLHRYIVDDTHIYSEVWSGTNDYRRRPQLSALFEAARQGAFDIVVVTTWNRLS